MTTSTPTPCVFLYGLRTYLRPLEFTDAPVLYVGINDPENWRYLSAAALLPKGMSVEEEWIKEKQKPNPKDITLGISLRENDDLIGTMGLHQIDYINRTAITGSVIFKAEHRNQGYGYDAKMPLLRHAFDFLNLRLIESRVIGFNERSARYSEKCGYKVDARLRQRHEREGQLHDELILSVTRADWLPKWEEYQRRLKGEV